ncbi:MAG: flagellar biosynthesis/type III secretory pathway protein [Lachnospiraceae bacterium]|nr:flagellar biosynthesis/type III secretory pathway protein [Lachnospiraceae bacterium]
MARADIEEQKNQMQAELLDRQQGMEHDLVDVITEVIEKVFMVQFADKKEIVLHLVDNALSNIEGSKIFQIKVSEYNYEFLENNKMDLQDRVGSDVQVDIVLDPLLDQSQCIIETDGGIFDCSLGVQLENLIKDLRSLS